MCKNSATFISLPLGFFTVQVQGQRRGGRRVFTSSRPITVSPAAGGKEAPLNTFADLPRDLVAGDLLYDILADDTSFTTELAPSRGASGGHRGGHASGSTPATCHRASKLSGRTSSGAELGRGGRGRARHGPLPRPAPAPVSGRVPRSGRGGRGRGGPTHAPRGREERRLTWADEAGAEPGRGGRGRGGRGPGLLSRPAATPVSGPVPRPGRGERGHGGRGPLPEPAPTPVTGPVPRSGGGGLESGRGGRGRGGPTLGAGPVPGPAPTPVTALVPRSGGGGQAGVQAGTNVPTASPTAVPTPIPIIVPTTATSKKRKRHNPALRKYNRENRAKLDQSGTHIHILRVQGQRETLNSALIAARGEAEFEEKRGGGPHKNPVYAPLFANYQRLKGKVAEKDRELANLQSVFRAVHS